MTLRPGQAWGEQGFLPTETPVVSTDHDLAALLEQQGMPDRQPEQRLVVALSGGDLCTTLGGRGDVGERLGTETTLMPVDIGLVRSDAEPPRIFAAHAVWRARFWRGPAVVVMNADALGAWRPAPRAHPGDGKLDVVEGELRLIDRLSARQRARSGDHLPHPDLVVSRTCEKSFELPRRGLWLDGRHVGAYKKLDISILPNAVLVAV